MHQLDAADDWAESKIMLLENKLKEQNLKFRGFSEDIDPSPDLCSFLLNWLALDLESGVAPVIDNAFRLGQDTKGNLRYPRDILATILTKSRSEKGFLYHGKRNIVLLDLPSETLLRRKALKPIISQLLEDKIRFKWFSPTSFYVLHQGQQLQVTDMDSGYLLLDTLQITYEKPDLLALFLLQPPRTSTSIGPSLRNAKYFRQ